MLCKAQEAQHEYIQPENHGQCERSYPLFKENPPGDSHAKHPNSL